MNPELTSAYEPIALFTKAQHCTFTPAHRSTLHEWELTLNTRASAVPQYYTLTKTY